MIGAIVAMLWAGMLGLGGWWAAGHGFRQPAGWPRAIGAAVVAWCWSTLGSLALGLDGLLARGPLLAWAASGLALAGLIRRLVPDPAVRPAGPPELLDAAAKVGLALTLWAIAASGIPAWIVPEKAISDGPIYHLYFAARWWKSGRLELIPAPFGDQAVSYVPANGEALFAAMMAVVDGDWLARAGPFVFLILAAASSFAIARLLGAGASASILAVGLLVTTIHMFMNSFVANVDVLFAAGYLAAVFFFLEYARGDGGVGALALGALAAGVSWGTKVIGLVFMPPLLAAAAVAVLIRSASYRTRLGHLLLLAAGPALMAGYWYVRNARLTGNPLYPLQVSVAGRAWLPGWFESSAMQYSPFFIPPGDLRSLADLLVNVVDPRPAPLWVAGLLAVWIPLRGHPERRWARLVSAGAVANIALYWIIPYRTQQRFLLPAVGLATAPLAVLLDRARWLRWAASGLLAVHVLTPSIWPLVPFGQQVTWGLSGRLTNATNGLVPAIPPPARWMAVPRLTDRLAMVTLPLVTFALALLAALASTSAFRDPSMKRWVRAAIAAIALLALPCAAAWNEVLSFREAFPRGPLAHAWDRLDRLAGPRPARIAYAGTNLAYYLMGRNQRHDVVYVNVDAHRGWRMHDYHRDAIARGEPNWPDPRPGWDRIHPDYEAWLANLAVESIDYLFVARPDPFDGLFNIADTQGYPIERAWADTHPESFTLVYGPPDGDINARIYRVHPAKRPVATSPNPRRSITPPGATSGPAPTSVAAPWRRST
jgi:hypothetical protein